MILLIVVIAGGGYFGYRLMQHEKNQNSQIANLQGEVDEVNAKLDSLDKNDSEGRKFLSSCDQDHYNILFIGNSITIHPYADYWWSDKRGMAATTNDKDYVHLTVKGLESKQSLPVNYKAVFFRTWETLSYDRAETYDIIDKYMNDKVNAVGVQLGENVSDTSTYESDYKALLEHIKESAPNAKIITIGDFWKDDTKDTIKKNVADSLDIPYVDLSSIQDDPSYQIGLGAEVEGDDGKMHKIEHEGVAKHPNDKGMAWIADKLLKVLE